MRTATFPPTGAPWYLLARRTKFRTSTLHPPTEAASLGVLLTRPEPFLAGLPTESGSASVLTAVFLAACSSCTLMEPACGASQKTADGAGGGPVGNRSVFKLPDRMGTNRSMFCVSRPERLGHSRIFISWARTFLLTFRAMGSGWLPQTRSIFQMRSGCWTRLKRNSHPQSKHSLERCLAEAQGVGDDGDGTKAHGGAGKHGAKQPAKNGIQSTGSDGDADGVIEKSKREILFDVADGGAAQLASPHDSAQVTLHKRDARTFDRDIRACAHGNADVGSGERGGVVNAVARHSHDVALLAKLLDNFDFLLRLDFRLDFFDLELTRDQHRCFSSVAGEHDHAYVIGA